MALTAVVLAAGAGTRFGGRKPLAQFRHHTLLEYVVHAVTDGGCQPILVVAGADEDVATEARRLRATVLDNPEWRTGMASSLRAGLAAAPDDSEGVVIVLADQPLLAAEAVKRVADAITAGAVAARAAYAGKPGHPVALSAGVLGDVAASLAGDVGAGPWLRAHAALVVDVDCTELGDPRDVDTPADLQNLSSETSPRPEGRP